MILVIGFGNPGRLDDGLGPAAAEAVGKMGLPDVAVDSDYQLMVEDAATVAQYETVIFVDAAVGGREPFSFTRVEPLVEISFSSHSVEPREVMGLAQKLFGAKTEAYLLGIRGYQFNEFGYGFSAQAGRNLDAALVFLEEVLKEKTFSGRQISV